MRLLLLAPAEVEGDLAGERLVAGLCGRSLSALEHLLPESPGAGDLSPPELEIGTRGGMSLGAAGARNEPDLPESLLGDPSPFSDLLSSFFGVLDLLPPLLELLFSLSLSLSFESLLDFSIGGMIDLEGVVSLPMLLHVAASRANGLFLASN